MTLVGYESALRIYEPLPALPGPARRAWQDYVARVEQRDYPVGRPDERAATRAALLAGAAPVSAEAVGQPAPADPLEHAYVRRVDGVTLLCPWQLRVRRWLAVEQVRDSLPEPLRSVLLTPVDVAVAAAGLAAWRAREPGQRVAIRTATWTVPIVWFTLFEPAERVVVVDRRRSPAANRPTVGGGVVARSLTYTTAMSRARRRGARALQVLRRTLDDAPMIAEMEDLARWLEEFHPRAQVELDYADLVGLLGDEDLHTDESARDVEEALAALADGDGQTAAAAYHRVSERWQAVGAWEARQ